MNNIIDRVSKQFREKIASTEILQIEVTEWPDEQGKPTVIYFRPLTSLHLEAFNKIVDLIRKENLLAAVDILILRALNADLTPMFKPVHRIELIKNVDPQVLLEIIGKMGELDAASDEKIIPDIETIEKN